MTDPPRRWRSVVTEWARAEQHFVQGVAAGVVFALLSLGVGLWEGLVSRRWDLARPLSVAFAAAMVLSAVTIRGSRVAAALLVALCAGTGVWYVLAGGRAIYLAYGYALVLAAVVRVLYAFRLPALQRELAATWSPHVITPGDIYTVRDSGLFAVVKVLGVTPGRVHVREFGMRYAERPWHVKSSMLEGPNRAPGPSYAHLPLDQSEFVRWEPWFMKREPVHPGELQAMAAWQLLHESLRSADGARP